MKNRNFIFKKIIFLLLYYSNLYGKELNTDTYLTKNRGHHIVVPRGGRTKVRVNIAPISNEYDSDYLEYRENYSECIPYYFYYGFPPSSFNFGLRVRRGGVYYYCPKGYYYKRSKYRDSHDNYIDRGRIKYRH